MSSENKDQIEYRGEIIEKFWNGFIWNGIAWPKLEMAKKAIDRLIRNAKYLPKQKKSNALTPPDNYIQHC